MASFKPDNKKILRNTIFLYGRLLLVLFLNVYTTRLVLNALGVEDYGIYNVVCSFVSLFSFLNSSLSNGIQRFYNYEAGKNGEVAITKVYNTSFFIQLILSLFIFILLEVFGVWYLNTKMVIEPERLKAANWVFQLSVLSLLFVVMQIPYSAAVMAYEKMDFYAFVGVFDAIVKTILIVLLPTLHGDKLMLYGGLMCFAAIVDFLLYFSFCKIKIKAIRLNSSFSKKLFGRIFKFSGWNLMEMFAWTSQNQGVAMILNLFCGAVVNAAQGIANQVSGALNGLCSNLVAAFRPQLVQSYSVGDYKRTTEMMFMMSKAMFILLYMMAIPVILDIDYILSIWLGNNVPEYTSKFCILILISMIPRNFTMALSQVVHATGIMRNYQVVSALVVICSLPLSYVILKMGFDPSLVYFAFIFVCVVLWTVDIYLLKRVYPLDVPLYLSKIVLPCLCVFVTAPLVPYFLRVVMPQSFLRIVCVAMSSIICCIVLGYFLLLNRRERQYITDDLKVKVLRKK